MSTGGSAYWVSGWPNLVAQWHPTRNNGVTPAELSHGSGRKVWWQCSEGPDHEWTASPNNRTAGRTGCPFCAGRKVSVTNSVSAVRPDLARQWHPTRNGALQPDGIVAGSTTPVWWKCPLAADHEWRATPHDRWIVDGGCPFCLCRRVSVTNSLAGVHPDLAREWHPTRNGKAQPSHVVAGSARMAWWRCERHHEHEWRASVCNRSRGSGCPFCAGRKASPQHCLALAYPAIAAEWHPTRNGSLSPDSVTPRARRDVWWRCAQGHEWLALVYARTRRRTGCPACAHPDRVRASTSASSPPSRRHRCATAVVREEHRQIEQTLSLLLADRGIASDTIARFVATLTAHLAAEDAILFPALESAWRRPLADHRALHAQIRTLLARVVRSSASGGPPVHALSALDTAFREHVRLFERAALPWLDANLASAAHQALGRRMAAITRA